MTMDSKKSSIKVVIFILSSCKPGRFGMAHKRIYWSKTRANLYSDALLFFSTAELAVETTQKT